MSKFTSNYHFFFAHLRNSLIRKKLSCNFALNNKNLILSQFLMKENLILSYFINEEKKIITLYLKYYNEFSVLKSIKVFSHRKCHHYSKFSLFKLQSKSNFFGKNFCVSTEKGLLTLTECNLFNIGGKVIFSYNV